MTIKYRRQEPPFCVQVELCEGCNLRCSFCGLQGIRAPKEKNFKLMERDTIERLALQIDGLRHSQGWNPRVEFAMHGEPSMHPDFVGMVETFCSVSPRSHVMMTSNGGGFLGKPGPVEKIRRLFAAGVRILALDDYDGAGYVPKIREAVYAAGVVSLAGDNYDLWVGEYPDDQAGNPHQRRKRHERVLSFVRDITKASKGTHATLTNHAGSGGPALEEPLREQCAKPFREMGVRWDGSVAMCCNDWRGVYKCGNVRDTPIDQIWQGEEFGAAREILFHGRRDLIGPCAKCDYHTYRNGLLPDNAGKATLPSPRAETKMVAARAQRGAPLAKPHLRPWEGGES